MTGRIYSVHLRGSLSVTDVVPWLTNWMDACDRGVTVNWVAVVGRSGRLAVHDEPPLGDKRQWLATVAGANAESLTIRAESLDSDRGQKWLPYITLTEESELPGRLWACLDAQWMPCDVVRKLTKELFAALPGTRGVACSDNVGWVESTPFEMYFRHEPGRVPLPGVGWLTVVQATDELQGAVPEWLRLQRHGDHVVLDTGDCGELSGNRLDELAVLVRHLLPDLSQPKEALVKAIPPKSLMAAQLLEAASPEQPGLAPE